MIPAITSGSVASVVAADVGVSFSMVGALVSLINKTPNALTLGLCSNSLDDVDKQKNQDHRKRDAEHP